MNGFGEIVQPGKCLLCKHEGLNLGSYESQAQQRHISVISVIEVGEQRQVHTWIFSSQPRLMYDFHA